MTEISRNIYEAEKAQDRANNDLDTASGNTDMIRNQVQDVKIQNLQNVSNVCHHCVQTRFFFCHVSD